jgi:hypothetical protein
MNTTKFEPDVKNRARASVEKGDRHFFKLAVAREMNPALRDLSDEELSVLLNPGELVKHLKFDGGVK